MCVLGKGVSACVWKDNEFKYVYEAGVCVCVEIKCLNSCIKVCMYRKSLFECLYYASVCRCVERK